MACCATGEDLIEEVWKTIEFEASREVFMMIPQTCTVSFYEAWVSTITFLRSRLSGIVAKNPFLCGRLVTSKTSRAAVIVHNPSPRASSIDKLVNDVGDIGISPKDGVQRAHCDLRKERFHQGWQWRLG